MKNKISRLYPKEAIWMEQIESKKLPPIDLSFLNTLDLDQVDDLILFGVGQGEVYQSLKGWLKKKRNRLLILIEDDLAILKGLLESKVGSDILKQEHVQLLYHQRGAENESLYQRLMWQGWERRCKLIKDPRYDQDAFEVFKNTLLYDQDRMKWFSSEFKSLGVGYYINFYQNLPALASSYEGISLFGKAKNVPAVIVGAGPSLNKNGAQLKAIGQKGLIFAGGSSLPALKMHGISPHFGGGIDPNSMQQERLSAHGKVDFPFFYRLRLNEKALKEVTGPKLYLPGSGVYQTASWIEEQLQIGQAEVLEGYNIINLLTDVAVQMGCNPIIFVGMDLAYTNGKAYADGVKWPVSPPDVVDGVDIHGNAVMTRWLWLKESYWLTTYVKEHPEVRFMNATEGGIGFIGVENRMLSDVIKEDLQQEVVSESFFKFPLLNVSEEKITSLIQELRASLERISILLKEMKLFYESADVSDFKGSFPEEGIWAMQLQEEPAFQAILSVFDEYMLQRLGYSPLLYLIQRDGMNLKRAKKMMQFQIERIQYLEQVIEMQYQMMEKLTR